MARPTRSNLVEPGRPLHVIVRGNNRRRLFSSWTDYTTFLRFLSLAAERYGCAVHVVTLMANHVHLIVTPPSAQSLSRFVHCFAQRYAVYRNAQRGGSGKLFEERFKSFGIRDEAHFGRVMVYIELNPIRAGLATAPDAYPWTTYRLHTGDVDRSHVPTWAWTPSSWWLGLGRTTRERAGVYRDHLGAHIEKPELLLDDDEHTEAILVAESASEPYGRRLERPDRSRASEDRRLYATSGNSERSRGGRQEL